MTTMEDAKVRRRQWSGAVTRHLGVLGRSVDDNDLEAVLERLPRCQAAFNHLEEAHDVYHNFLTKDEDLAASVEWFTEVETKYLSSIKQVKLYITRASAPQEPVSPKNIDAQDELSLKLINALHLPKVEIDCFSGDPIEYCSFIAIFDELVGTRVSDDSVKLTRLLQYTKGEAKRAIRDCVLVGGSNGYRQARSILERRYGNAHLIAQQVISNIKHGKMAHKGSDLQQYGDDLKVAFQTLSSLGMVNEINTQEFIRTHALHRCPPSVRNKWCDHALQYRRRHGVYPLFEDFVSFVISCAEDMVDPVYGSDCMRSKGVCNQSMVTQGHLRSPVPLPSVASISVTNDSKPVVRSNDHQGYCVLCSQSHAIFNCANFKAMSPTARFNIARQHKLCFNCLCKGHMVSECRSRRVCDVPGCGRRHSKLLHMGRPTEALSRGVPQGGAAVHNSMSRAQTCTNDSAVFLPMVRVQVNSKISVLALLDSGSTNTFVSESLVSQLGLKGKLVTHDLSTLLHDAQLHTESVSLRLGPSENVSADSVRIDNVCVVPRISARYPGFQLDLNKYTHLTDLQLQSSSPGCQADLLIGMDNGALLVPLETRCGRKSDPYAVRTHFGWTVCGSVSGPSSGAFSNVINVDLHEQCESNVWIKELSDEESVSWSVEDHRVIELWDSRVRRVDGHYELPIPWRGGRPKLPDNEFVAKRRLDSLCKRLDKSGMTDKYSQCIDKFVGDGHAEVVPVGDEGEIGSVWYLPHHSVESESKPGKVRIVFDCAAQLNGVSLNNQCLQGPVLTNKLVGVLLRFRQFKYAIMADIEAMYLQIRIPLTDRDTLRFLWYLGGELVKYRMTSHLFGGVWCAASSTYALHRTVDEFPCSDLVKDVVKKCFYVDDMLASVPSVDEARQLMTECKTVLKCGGFNLTKYVANDVDLLSSVDPGDRATEVKEIAPDTTSKALGVKWDITSDSFGYVLKFDIADSVMVTRRVMLSKTASLYDPLGFVAPIILRGKLLFQEATRRRLDWDEPVPDDLRDAWHNWMASLYGLLELKVPRVLVPDMFVGGVCELHHFCDASEVGYGACSYLRCINSSGNVHVVLVASKGRLAPIKTLTIPRLELCGAVLSVRLDEMLRRELDIPLIPSTYWTDSRIVLGYIQNETKRFKVYVANRVSDIRRASNPDQWMHISSECNPADLLSRGCNVSEMPASWLNGPAFLTDYRSNWPAWQPVELPDDAEVQRPVVVHNVVSDNVSGCPIDMLIEHYSCMYRLKKAVSWWLRLRNHLLKKPVAKGPIMASELVMAEKIIVKHVQMTVYSPELQSLGTVGHVNLSSSLSPLSPVLCDGVIVSAGRLRHAATSENARFPIILPRNHKVSRLIAAECHNEAHVGVEWCVSRVRRKFWIIGMRALMKDVCRKCVVCRRLYGGPMSQRMSDLPPERVNVCEHPFTYVGVDVFGPFMVKRGRAEVKRYGCIFTCMSVRAIHIEVLASLETDAFIHGLKRFVARRGCPKQVWCDNGTNFVGAHAELLRCWRALDQDAVKRTARQSDIEFVFNTPHASHHGGVWERMIRTIRKILLALLPTSASVSDDVLSTVMCEAENMVNSRPITKSSDDPNDLAALTPNHFLMCQSNLSLAWGEFDQGDRYRRSWRHAQLVADQFWKRWVTEYLPLLRNRSKWSEVKPNAKVGDVVLVADESLCRGQWPLAIIEQIKEGRDGLVRSVKVRTSTSSYVRPITKVIPLECA